MSEKIAFGPRWKRTPSFHRPPEHPVKRERDEADEEVDKNSSGHHSGCWTERSLGGIWILDKQRVLLCATHHNYCQLGIIQTSRRPCIQARSQNQFNHRSSLDDGIPEVAQTSTASRLHGIRIMQYLSFVRRENGA